MHRRRILTIPPGAPFLATFVGALIAGRIVEGFPGAGDPLSWSQARIYVPTRRAARALAAEIARRLDTPAVILPEIVPLGAIDANEAALFEESFGDVAPEAVSEALRRMTLAQLILKWGSALRGAIQHVDGGKIVTNADESFLTTSSPAQAFRMAGDLGALIDEFFIEGVDPGKLRELVPDRFDRYWAITLEFLKIAFEHWPKHLRELGLADRAERQTALIEAEIAKLQSAPPRKAEIVLGSTGTNAATAKLIACIAALPQGAVVLPGLDKRLDEASWSMLAPVKDDDARIQAAGHEQAALFRLLNAMGARRDDVEALAEPQGATAARIDFVRHALLPAETTDRWPQWRADRKPAWIDSALQDIDYIDAPDERLEALAVAIALREALETPERTSALVTPDRNLAHRVRAELARWNVEVDDSGGDPLAETPAGVLAGLVLACADGRAGAADAIALLHHTNVRLGFEDADFARIRTQAEAAALRGCAWIGDDPQASLAAAKADAADRFAHRMKREVTPEGWERIGDLFSRLAAALAPLRELRGEQPIAVWMQAHEKTIGDLVARAGDGQTFASEDERVLRELFEAFASAGNTAFVLSFDAYAALFADLARETVVRGPRRTHPRVKILGLLEARLLSADLVVLGGLDETVWPPAARTDEFLNRPMRAALGLTPPERRIGQTAHDFVMAMGAGRVVLSRAAKRDGAPAVPSRFVQRMEALAGAEPWKSCRKRGERYLDLAERIDHAGEPKPASRPEPRPPLDLRPTALSVTQVETWRRDPYAIYAQHILKLQPLDDPDPEDDYARFGTRLHDTLAKFHETCPRGALPKDAAGTLTRIAHENFDAALQDPDFRAFKWPRLLSFFAGFVAWENDRRGDIERIEVELGGAMPMQLSDGSAFTLTARADRFEFGRDGAVTIVDYKSGSPPSPQQVRSGLSPQLTLEAAMIQHGAFKCAPAGTAVRAACYVRIGKPGEVEAKSALGKDDDLAEVAQEHLDGLKKYASQFRNPDTPYLSRPIPQFKNRYDDYGHLARTSEWSSIDGEGAEGGE